MATNVSQEFFTDFLFFTLFLFYELFSGVTHWVPITLHLVTSLFGGGFAAWFVTKDLTLRSLAAILTGMCCASTAVCDFVFLTNYVSRRDSVITTGINVAIFAIAFLGAFYRIYCAGPYFDTDAAVVASGVAFVTAIYYLVWLIFFGERATLREFEIPDGSLLSGNLTAFPVDRGVWKDSGDHWIRQYTILVFTLSSVKSLIFVIKNCIKHADRKSEFFWLMSSVFLFLDYMVLLGNITPLIDETSQITFFSHGFGTTRSQIEGIFLAGAMAAAQSVIVFDATPSTQSLITPNGRPSANRGVQTIALLCASEPVAAVIQFLYSACFAALPLLCTVGATLGGELTATERLLLSVYAVHLSFRYWVQMKTTRFGVFCIVSLIGMTFDLAVIVAITLETIQAPILAIISAFGFNLTAIKCKASRTVFLTCVTSDVQVVFGIVASVSLVSTLTGVGYGTIQSWKKNR